MRLWLRLGPTGSDNAVPLTGGPVGGPVPFRDPYADAPSASERADL